MANRLDPEDRGILQFRPDIGFVEPDVEPQVPNPIDLQPEPFQLEDALEDLSRLKSLAQAVDSLATAVQSRADEKAKNLVIELDSSADPDTIQAMLRLFPGSNSNEITYDQYRQCKDDIRAKGIQLAEQGIVTPDDIETIRDQAQAAGIAAGTTLGGFGTRDGNRGLLRPELRKNFIIIPPLPIPEIQISFICILVNFICKEFIKPVVVSAGPPVSFAFKALPDQLCDPGFDLELPGLILLGKKPTGIIPPPEIPLSINITANI